MHVVCELLQQVLVLVLALDVPAQFLVLLLQRVNLGFGPAEGPLRLATGARRDAPCEERTLLQGALEDHLTLDIASLNRYFELL